jgi:CheY-like chemotaxis protein
VRPRPRVLVVDDDPDIRKLIASAFEDVNYVVAQAVDGATALAECRLRDPDVIVLDLQMPGMDSAKFLEAYRRIPGTRARIVAVSATPRGAETAATAHADAFLSKPFAIEGLVAAVRRQLGEERS